MDGAMTTRHARSPERTDGAFADASRMVLRHLDEHVPMRLWSVSQVVDDRQVHLTVTDNDLGVEEGDRPSWRESLCRAMWEGGAPRIAPDTAAVPQYRALAPMGTAVRAYVGAPLVLADGSLFGTLYGIHTAPQPNLRDHRALLDLLVGVLTATLHADEQAQSLARQLESTRTAADTDPLTGLLNLRAWQAVVEVEEARHDRVGQHASVGVVDLDDLKVVNDTGGHAAGDERIREAARVLRTTIRAGDHLARVGGDEFVVLCPRTSAEEVDALTVRLQSALAASAVPASLGSGTMDPGTGIREAQRRADQRMYEAKRRGRATAG
jgi:diguanylate cyclase (GGDEF)-like protein